MVTKEQIKRINELYNKQKSTGLTEDEKKEQSHLRRLYIDSVKQNLKAQLENIKIVSPDEKDGHKHSHHCDCEKHNH
ncbi:MAG TPA: DUF896 domain-containing protein [Thermoanaerobacterales bacterium]|jgi:uncharacterized protein YnzC (UPF0291/DUF896 family)|nr:DUF896 domain-containing protein [Thermoanaerobacterales bacterium]